MNRKQLILIIVIGLVVGAFGIYSYNSRKNSWEGSEKLGQKLIKNFPMNDIEHVSIKQAQNQLNLVKKSDTWTVQERLNYPANLETVGEFLRKVWDLKIAQPVEISAQKLGRLELQPPDKGAESGTLVEFKDKTDKPVNSLLLGKKHMRESHGGAESPFGGGGGGYPDGRYVMLGNDLQTVSVV